MLEMLSTCYTVVVIRQITIVLFSILISNFLLNVSFFSLSYDKFVGTDEAITCVCLVIHNKQNGM